MSENCGIGLVTNVWHNIHYVTDEDEEDMKLYIFAASIEIHKSVFTIHRYYMFNIKSKPNSLC